MKLQDYVNALTYFKESLEIYESLPLDEYVSHKLASIRSMLDKCFATLS